jgi:hypothetical protein
MAYPPDPLGVRSPKGNGSLFHAIIARPPSGGLWRWAVYESLSDNRVASGFAFFYLGAVFAARRAKSNLARTGSAETRRTVRL